MIQNAQHDSVSLISRIKYERIQLLCTQRRFITPLFSETCHNEKKWKRALLLLLSFFHLLFSNLLWSKFTHTGVFTSLNEANSLTQLVRRRADADMTRHVIKLDKMTQTTVCRNCAVGAHTSSPTHRWVRQVPHTDGRLGTHYVKAAIHDIKVSEAQPLNAFSTDILLHLNWLICQCTT